MRNDSGFYQLIIALPRKRNLRVGRLGRFSFPAGYYVYTGRAKRGLSARIARHMRKRKGIHWHIDYLLRYGRITKVNRYERRNLSECELNRRVERLSRSQAIAKGFGSSDCECLTHLIYFETKPKINPYS